MRIDQKQLNIPFLCDVFRLADIRTDVEDYADVRDDAVDDDDDRDEVFDVDDDDVRHVQSVQK